MSAEEKRKERDAELEKKVESLLKGRTLELVADPVVTTFNPMSAKVLEEIMDEKPSSVPDEAEEHARHIIDPSLWNKIMHDNDKEFPFILYADSRKCAFSTKAMQRILKERHKLDIDARDMIQNKVIFISKGSYQSLVSACSEDWVVCIEECTGIVQIMD